MSRTKENFTDIHMHVIPGVDDGASDYDEALRMLITAEEEGIRNIIATPHSGAFDGFFNPVKKTFNKLKEMVAEECIDVNLMLGAEIYVEGQAVSKVVSGLKRGKYPTLNGTEYVLVEFDICSEDYEDAETSVHYLTKNGYTPIIAHAEKYRFSVGQIYELSEQGCFLQVNFSDVIPGRYESEANEKAKRMLLDKKVDFFATDAHNMDRRPPIITESIDYLYQNYETDYIDKILYDNVKVLLS